MSLLLEIPRKNPALLVWLCLALLGFSVNSFGQDKYLVIEGKAGTQPPSPPNEILILVYKSGSVSDRINPDKEGNFSLKLDFQKDYKISFTKKGMVSQSFTVNTAVDKERIADAFYPKEIIASLFPDEPGFDKSKMPDPVGKIFFQEDINDFEWDEGYQAVAGPKFAAAKELALKQIELNKMNANAGVEAAKKLKEEEERRKKEEEEKRKADEEKARAEKEKQRLDELEAKKAGDAAKAEAAEKDRLEKEKKRLENLAQKEAEEKAKSDAANAEKAEKEKNAAALKAQKELEESQRLAAEAKTKEEKEKLRLEALAKKEKEEKEKEQLLAEEKARKEKEKSLAIEKKEADKKAEEERIAQEKKKAEQDAAAAAEKAKQDELNAAANKAKKLEEDKEKARLKAIKDEENRLAELARQEELFKKRTANFTPVMGIYTSTVNKIGEKQAFGYINFGNGLGNQDLTKEEYDEYAKKYKKK